MVLTTTKAYANVLGAQARFSATQNLFPSWPLSKEKNLLFSNTKTRGCTYRNNTKHTQKFPKFHQ